MASWVAIACPRTMSSLTPIADQRVAVSRSNNVGGQIIKYLLKLWEFHLATRFAAILRLDEGIRET